MNYKELCKRKWDSIAKPLNGMGILEDYIAKIAEIQQTLDIDISRRCVAVMCADNGIVAENVTQTGSEVTAIVAGNIMNGKASVTNMAKAANADVFAYDVGMITDSEIIPKYKVAYGTENFIKSPAMTKAQALTVIQYGIGIAGRLKADGYKLIASGEMGIGNTTTSSAVAAVLLDVPPKAVTGRGAGLSSDGIQSKIRVIEEGIRVNAPDKTDPVDVLAKVGGYDIAAMCGLFLGGGIHKIPVIIDGFISSVSALLAVKINPAAADYMLASHMSAEPAAEMVMAELGFTAPLRCGMALGEGTGAVALMPLLDMAAAVYINMPSFSDTNIEEYKPL